MERCNECKCRLYFEHHKPDCKFRTGMIYRAYEPGRYPKGFYVFSWPHLIDEDMILLFCCICDAVGESEGALNALDTGNAFWFAPVAPWKAYVDVGFTLFPNEWTEKSKLGGLFRFTPDGLVTK
jgi:hypothetical protein